MTKRVIRTVHDLAGGVYVDPKRGPAEQLHAVSWNANVHGARRAACGKVGRFVPPAFDADFATFPDLDAVKATPNCPPPMRQMPSRQGRRPREERMVTRSISVDVEPSDRVLVLAPHEFDELLDLVTGIPAGAPFSAVDSLARKVNDLL